MGEQAIFDNAEKLTLVVALLLALLSGARGMWVFGWHYRDLQKMYDELLKERDMLFEIALRGTAVAETSASLVESALRTRNKEDKGA